MLGYISSLVWQLIKSDILNSDSDIVDVDDKCFMGMKIQPKKLIFLNISFM